MIEQAPAEDGRNDSERDGDDDGDGHRRNGEDHRVGQPIANLLGDRRAEAERLPEVAARHADHERAVLRQQRPVEPERLAEHLDLGRRRTSPSIDCAGSPGTRWMSAKTRVATPSSTGTVSSRRLSR